MKKRLALLLLFIMFSVILLPVQGFAQYDKALENAIAKVKTVINTDGYDKFNSSISVYNGKTTYNLMWSDSKGKLGNISVTIDSSNNILSYYKYNPSDYRSQRKLPKISKEDALANAKKFITKVAPDIAANISYQEYKNETSVMEFNYQFFFVRTVNGIPFPSNNVTITVNKNTGEIENYHCNWNFDLTFPDKNGIMSLEDARKVYKEKIGLQLMYKYTYIGDKPEVYLAYTSPDYKAIDAKSGEIIQIGYYYTPVDEAAMKYNKSMGTGGSPDLTPVEKDAVKKFSNIISEQKAEELARANKFLKLDSNYKLNGIYLYIVWPDQNKYTWNLSFSKTVDGQNYYTDVGIDAQTGEIKSFYRSVPYNEKSQPKYGKDESLQMAKDFLKEIQPEKFNQVEYTEIEPQFKPLTTDQTPRQYNFKFVRKVNNAYFNDNGFNVAVDAINGEITSYDFNWYEGQLPSTDKVMPLDKAYEIFLDKIGLQLQYITTYPVYEYIPDMPTQKPEVKLVYAKTPGKIVNIDPITGELLGYDGKPIKAQDKASYTDIKGNYAENTIKILAEYGISLPGSKFLPDQPIKQKEFLYLLSRSMNYYTDYDLNDQKSVESMYNYLAFSGIIRNEEMSPDSTLQRQDAVKYIIRALKYDKVADIKGIFMLPFKDANKINSDLKGYVAIAYGLNIVKGSNGYFNPNDKLTRAQAIMIIYNYLNVE